MKRIKNVVENVVEILNTQEKNILNVIAENPKITQKQMAEQLKITTRQISRILKDLKEKKIIERIGSDRKGYWKIKNLN